MIQLQFCPPRTLKAHLLYDFCVHLQQSVFSFPSSFLSQFNVIDIIQFSLCTINQRVNKMSIRNGDFRCDCVDVCSLFYKSGVASRDFPVQENVTNPTRATIGAQEHIASPLGHGLRPDRVGPIQLTPISYCIVLYFSVVLIHG